MEEKIYLEYANEAAKKIREINQILSGTESPEDGSLLGDVDYCIYAMIQIYLAPIVGKEVFCDELNNMATEIMFAEKDEIDGIIKASMT